MKKKFQLLLDVFIELAFALCVIYIPYSHFKKNKISSDNFCFLQSKLNMFNRANISYNTKKFGITIQIDLVKK